MVRQLASLTGLTVFPSQGNFVLCKLPQGRDGRELRDYLIREHGVYIRECGNKLGFNSRFLRLVVRPHADVQRLLAGMYAYLCADEEPRRGRRRAPEIEPAPVYRLPGSVACDPS